jgi:hypothetical protein
MKQYERSQPLLNDLKAAYPRSGSTTISLCVDDNEILQSTACDHE